MKTIPLIAIFVLVALYSTSQITRKQYIERWQLLAIEEMNRSGIPASITMAQGILESGNGNSELARKSNNHFGIKCKKSWKGKKVYYDDDAKNECFRKYRSVEDSYIDHTDFLMSNPRYGSLFSLKTTDYKGWARGLKKAGYATARDYDKRLIKIIEDNKLYRLDKKIRFDELAVFEQKTVSTKSKPNSLTLTHYQTHKVHKVNGIKAVVTRSNDTYEMLAQELGIGDWELYKFNDQSAGYRPVANEVVYIKAKKRKSKTQASHKVEAGETMHYLSQRYGIKLKSLYRLNKTKAGREPKPGTVVYLQKIKR